MWVLAGLSTFALAALLAGAAYFPGRGGFRPSAGRKAALLGIAAAVGFGFVAAVIKELSAHLPQGPAGVFSNWSPYVLLLSGAAAMFLASNAFQAGSLAASQPGLTIVDPLVAGALGVVLFGERLQHDPLVFAGELLAASLVVLSVIMLSLSSLVREAAPAVVAATVPPEESTTGWVPGDHQPRSARPPSARPPSARPPFARPRRPARRGTTTRDERVRSGA
jgi:hypothetical protein